MIEQTATPTKNGFDYLYELIRLDESLPKFIEVPPHLATQIGYELIRPNVFIKRPPITCTTTSTIKKSSLISYFLEGAIGPCYCGSGKRYGKCHSKNDLPALVITLLQMNEEGKK